MPNLTRRISLRAFGFVLFLALSLLLTRAMPARAATVTSLSGFGDSLGLSPFWKWKTLESEHFRLTYPEELHEVAQKAAAYFEEAQKTMGPWLRWTPHYKPQILLVDNADAANGLTSAVGRFGILLYTTPPDNWFSTYYYDDWLRELVFHEYTHFLNIDTTRGLYEPLRILTGDSLLPNSTWPNWMLEGLAVYAETRFTSGGRGRSPYYDMVLRSAVEAGVLDTNRFITLDKINGPNPRYPSGEDWYLFGYELMNQAAHSFKPGQTMTADGGDPLTSQDDVLGLMSYRSAGRVPYFINGNIENVSGKDWYGHWDDFVKEARERSERELRTIRSEPVTPIEPLTHQAFEVFGTALSPDGKLAAFTENSTDLREGLFVMDLQTQASRRLLDKTLGAVVSFTPDSRQIVYSAVHRTYQYYQYSDLGIYDLDRDSWHWLTTDLRARDPDLSRDGNWVVFTIAERYSTALAVGRLKKVEGEYRLTDIRRLYVPPTYDLISTPRFSPDAKTIAFTLHPNGKTEEALATVSFDPTTGTTLDTEPDLLVQDGKINRFPTYDPQGALYFISDRTGVENLYRLDGIDEETPVATQVTNVTGGLYFPVFSRAGELYASAFSYQGFDLAKIKLTPQKYDSAKLTLEKPVTPASDAASVSRAQFETYPTQDYSLFPSIWPRAWAPILFTDSTRYYIGGDVLGFDATDQHRYNLLIAYDSLTKRADYLLDYSNRQLGVTLSGYYYGRTTSVYEMGGVLNDYIRENDFTLSASYPFLFTYSQLEPYLALNGKRLFLLAPGANPTDSDVVDRGEYVPSVDGILFYSSAESSRLAITSEEGRTTSLGARGYLNSGDEVVKALFTDAEYLRLFDHTVLIPSLKASWVSHSSAYLPSDVLVQGRLASHLVNTLPSNNFDQIAIRGYPMQNYYAKEAAVAALDYRFPLARIFRGWGTNPVFLQNLYAFTFGEAGYFPYAEPGVKTLPSAGAGLSLTTDLFTYIPLKASVEYHQGFQTAVGGSGELFFELGVQNLSF